MGKYLITTIDVERDCGTNWRGSYPVSYKSVTIGIRERLQPLFDEMRITPTYFISGDVLHHQPSIDYLLSICKRAELAAHLHGEFHNPKKTNKFSRIHTSELQCLYPETIEHAKLKDLTDLFKEKFGFPPFSFRAGRFAIGMNTARILEELGYRIDSSITPHGRWKYENAILDFTSCYDEPYFVNLSNPFEKGISDFLEIPITIDPYFGWLRPSKNTTKNMIKLIVKQLYYKTKIYLNMMFHSSEYVVGASPYSLSEANCSRYINALREVYKFCQRTGFKFPTLKEFYQIFCEENNALTCGKR